MKAISFSLLLGALSANSAGAKCKPNGGKIGYSYCVRYTVEKVESGPSWLSKHLLGASEYDCDRVLTAKVIEVKIPSPDLQAKDSASRIKVGDLVKIGIQKGDSRAFKTGEETVGLWEKICLDQGDPDFELVLNAALSAFAYEPSGTIRRKETKISCSK